MHDALPELIEALASAVAKLEALADELMLAAEECDGEPVADVMRGLARRHRIKVLELQGQHAALMAAHAVPFRRNHSQS